MTTYLKVIGPNNRACHGGSFDYTAYLPQEGKPGKALPERESVLCQSGWHWCTPESLASHWAVAGMRVYEAEPSADVTPFDGSGKCVSGSGRLVRSYPLPEWWQSTMAFVDAIPDVPWLRRAQEPLLEWRLFTAPAWDAARAAAWDAARAAARAAAWDAAWDASRDAAWDAARDAARAAARAAARGAAWAAAGAAAGAAAWAAARGAAWAAARAAEITAFYVLCHDLPISQIHRDHVAARWEVWTRGYALLGDLDGVLYVYGAEMP